MEVRRAIFFSKSPLNNKKKNPYNFSPNYFSLNPMEYGPHQLYITVSYTFFSFLISIQTKTMNPSSTLTPSSLIPLPFPFPLSSSTKRHRFKLSLPRSSSSSSVPPPKDLTGIENVVDKLSPPLRLATSAVVIASAVAAGFHLGSKFGGSRNAAVGGAVALGVAGGAAAYALNAAAPQVAAVNLHNFVADLDHPSLLKNEDIDRIANRFI